MKRTKRSRELISLALALIMVLSFCSPSVVYALHEENPAAEGETLEELSSAVTLSAEETVPSEDVVIEALEDVGLVPLEADLDVPEDLPDLGTGSEPDEEFPDSEMVVEEEIEVDGFSELPDDIGSDDDDPGEQHEEEEILVLEGARYDENPETDSGTDDTLEGLDATRAAIRAAKSSVGLLVNQTAIVTLTLSGCNYDDVRISITTTNKSALIVEYGQPYHDGTCVDLYLTGKGTGSGTLKIAIQGKQTASISTSTSIQFRVTTLSMKLLPDQIFVGTNGNNINNAQLKLSGSTTESIKLVLKKTGSSYFDAAVKGSGRYEIQTTGKKYGKGTIELDAISAIARPNGRAATIQTLKANIYVLDMSVSPSSASIPINTSKSFTVTVKSQSGNFGLRYVIGDTTIVRGKWEAWKRNGNTYTTTFTATGRNPGSCTVDLYVRNSSYTAIQKKSIQISVTREDPTVAFSPKSLSLNVGERKTVTATVNNTNYYRLTLNISDYAVAKISSTSRYGNTVEVQLEGLRAGTAYMNGSLYDIINGKTVRAEPVQVSVVDATPKPDPPPTPSSDLKYYAYSFENPSGLIPLSICQLVFGNTQMARQVYYADIGTGGQCFGMAGSAALIAASTAPNASSFSNGKARNYDLKKTDQNSSMQLQVHEFVEAMHITQVSSAMKEQTGIGSMVSIVKSETAQGRPVMICIRSYRDNAGHAILAYGFEDISSTECSIKIYDSNYPDTDKRLTVRKSSSGGTYNSWEYAVTWNRTWISSYEELSYITYDTYYNNVYVPIWNQNRTLNQKYSLLITTENKFSVYRYQDDMEREAEPIVIFDITGNGSEGFVQIDENAGVYLVPKCNVLPDGTFAEQPNMLFLPQDYYFVQDDDTTDGMNLTLTGLDLSVRVNTDVDTFRLGVSDDEGKAGISLTPNDGEVYTISLGTSRDGNSFPETVVAWNGAETGADESGQNQIGEVSIGLSANGTLDVTGLPKESLDIRYVDPDSDPVSERIPLEGDSILSAETNAENHTVAVKTSCTSPSQLVVTAFDARGAMVMLTVRSVGLGVDAVSIPVDEQKWKNIREVKVLLMDSLERMDRLDWKILIV